MMSSLVESHRWTVVVPVPVVMELEGLSANPSQLGAAAKDALAFVGTRMKTHGLSLKVQTSKGNYLMNLGVVSEEVDFRASDERNMDDLILKIALWHQDNWFDRTAMLSSDEDRMQVEDPIKVVLLSLDRNRKPFSLYKFVASNPPSVRLKARSRQLPAASEKDLAFILTAGT